jgi:ribonuclease-3
MTASCGDLEQLLHHRFLRRDFLEDALTHTSASDRTEAPSGDYERLEFLGDRVLGLVIAERLLASFPSADAGELALRYNALVRREALVDVARRLELGSHIRMAKSEDAAGGRGKPAILADCCEAVLGALFLDGGLNVARQFVVEHWRPLFEEVESTSKDDKTALQEWAQGRGLTPPEYAIVDRVGPAHATTFTVRARLDNGVSMTGTGLSRRSAEQMAAAALLEAVKR